MKLAVSEVDPSGNGPVVVVRAGVFGPADLASLDVTKLPPAIPFTAVSELPAEGAQGRLFDDDLVLVGAPPEPERGKGINVVWFDLASKSLRVKMSGEDRLLRDRVGIVATSVAFSGGSREQAADLDLMWIESSSEGSTLKHGTLRCR